MMTGAPSAAYEGLLYTVFQQLRHAAAQEESCAPGQGLAVVFTSANSGEGVTHTLEALVGGLARDQATRTVVVHSETLRGLTVSPSEIGALCSSLPARAGSLAVLKPGGDGPHAWGGSWEYRRDVIEQLRKLFDYVLVDCAALRESNDLLTLAPFVGGIILVVEAGRTRREQVLHAEKTVQFAQGKLLGHILNKRSYVVPEWIYRHL